MASNRQQSFQFGSWNMHEEATGNVSYCRCSFTRCIQRGCRYQDCRVVKIFGAFQNVDKFITGLNQAIMVLYENIWISISLSTWWKVSYHVIFLLLQCCPQWYVLFQYIGKAGFQHCFVDLSVSTHNRQFQLLLCNELSDSLQTKFHHLGPPTISMYNGLFHGRNCPT